MLSAPNCLEVGKLGRNDVGKFLVLERAVFETRIAECFSLFRGRGVEPVMFKGWLAASNYPDGHRRQYADLDIAVSPSEFGIALKQLPELFRKKIPIDLHSGLRHLDTLPWDKFFDRCEIRGVQGVEIRVPCPEDHLRILCVHWLSDGGEYRERLWDIYYAVANRPPDFDWDKCLGCVSEIRKEWVITCIGLAHKYLGLSINDLPFKDEAQYLPSWLTKFLETEWKRTTRLIPLRLAAKRPRLLVGQIRKRFPPNPIQSIVDTESSVKRHFLLPVQVRGLLRRSRISITRAFGR